MLPSSFIFSRTVLDDGQCLKKLSVVPSSVVVLQKALPLLATVRQALRLLAASSVRRGAVWEDFKEEEWCGRLKDSLFPLFRVVQGPAVLDSLNERLAAKGGAVFRARL